MLLESYSIMSIYTKLPSFAERLAVQNIELSRTAPRSLQVNIGKLCNLACVHCHVNAGPGRKELMTRETIDRVIDWFKSAATIDTVDITGGAPEMNPEFRYFVSAIRRIRPETKIIDRCNLTILMEPDYDDLAQFFVENAVQVVASMPCYQPENVDEQRGEGVCDASIAALRKLNSVGYGRGTGLKLDLVYNPLGASLPPDQSELESEYKAALKTHFDIVFDRLYTITNMPIARFLSQLKREGKSESYHELLIESFNPASVEGLMCRDTVSVDWEGRVYDCDFNQMLNLPLGGRSDRFLWELDSDRLEGSEIALGDHCFGCTAGAGSSCGGALDK